MHLAHLRLRDFRNYTRLDIDFPPGFHLLVGENAQGKTNVLEAIYLLATLRSFRGVGNAQLVRHGARGFFVGGSVVGQSTHDLKIYWSSSERRLSIDDQPVRKLTDYFGALRSVVFCTEDLLLVKGTGRVRRRFLDLLLAQTQPGYLTLLQRYTAALQARNALLKRPPVNPELLDPFTRELIAAGDPIMRHRRELVPRLSALARLAYRRISNDAEELRAGYAPSVKEDFAVELSQSADRERHLRMTVLGPHRDDLTLHLHDKPAAHYSSEGQKRSLSIALKMAQAEYLTGTLGTPPILLIDDVMGELDAGRRAGLMPLLERAEHTRGQVFMTCTAENWPRELARSLRRWNVRQASVQAVRDPDPPAPQASAAVPA